MIVCITSVFAGNPGAQQRKNNKDLGPEVTENRQVESFDKIVFTCVGNIRFTQSDIYSLRLEGPQEYIEAVKTTVKGSTLHIDCKENEKFNKGKKAKMDVYISAPSLSSVNIQGVGDFRNEGTLQCDKLSLQLYGVGNFDIRKLKADKVSLQLNGVGNMEVDMKCDNLNARMNGVGNMELSGYTRVADIRREGIGRIKRGNLTVGEK